MMFFNLTSKYKSFEAWMFDRFVGNRSLHIHAYTLENSGLADILSEKREVDFLDVGCGGGQNAIRLKERYPHLNIWGIDLSPDQIARAQQRAQERKYALHFKVADVQALPFPDASFDVVYSSGSVKHWPDPLRGISECWRVLKPGGEILLTDGTSDATLEQMHNFYDLLHFPKRIKKPLSALLYRRLIRPACPMETYRQIAGQLKMPEGAVSQLASLPLFRIHTQKPPLVFWLSLKRSAVEEEALIPVR